MYSSPSSNRRVSVSTTFAIGVLLGFIALTGCSSGPKLMPTPAIYADTDLNPLADVPPALQTSRVPVLYVTDRAPEHTEGQPADQAQYGQKRSRSAAFGVAEVEIGKNLSWDDLVKASRTAKRAEKLDLTVAFARELGRFAPTPPKLVISDVDLAAWHAATQPADGEVERRFIEELTDRLAQSRRKDVFIYVHGFNNSFHDSVITAGEVWHFVGREGVPIAYSWPAAKGGLRAYNYTAESVRFTIFHLKQTLRLIASCPAVERIHVVAHSRGTDVATSAIQELHLEIRGTADSQKTLKLGTVVLAAADLDIDSFIQRMATERIGQACERIVMYICNKDKALGMSNWLFSGMMRVGDVSAGAFEPEEIDALRRSRHLQIIDARVSDPGSFGHSYFHSSPAVSSDLILLLRYQLPPGGEAGRPLGTTPSGFWIIDDKYPNTGTGAWRQAIGGSSSVPETGGGISVSR